MIRPNPLKFHLPQEVDNKQDNKENDNNSSQLPYRSVLAVLTTDTVLIYDTHNTLPLCIARGLHYASLTDAAWSSDGRRLFVSSTDGYVSVLSFQEGELGEVYHEVNSNKEEAVTTKEATTPNKNVPPVMVPPCEPGQTASIVAPPAKRLKTVISPPEEIMVTNLSIGEPKKKKKRITPILLNNV